MGLGFRDIGAAPDQFWRDLGDGADGHLLLGGVLFPVDLGRDGNEVSPWAIT